LAGILFAIHPIHVEVVAAVYGRKDLLATLFTLSMVLLHQSAAQRGGWLMPLPVLAFACAMLSKEVGVVGLAFVGAYDWFVTRRHTALSRDEGRGWLYVGYAATLLVYHAVRIRVTGGVGVPETFYLDNPLVQAPLLERLATALAVMGKGVVLLILPLRQSPDYSFDVIPLVESLTDWRFLTTVGGLLAMGWVFLRSSEEKPVQRLLVLWYLAAILPTANLLVLVGTIFGERLLFLPSVAFCLGAGYVLGRTPEKLRPLAFSAAFLWMAALSFGTVRYAGIWRDDITLFTAAAELAPNSTKVQHKLGEELLRAGEIEASLPPLQKALDIAPDNQFAAQTLAQARTRIARKYLPQHPGGPTLSPPPEDPEILFILGQFSRERSDMAGARAYWEAALAVDSLHARSLAELGSMKFLQGDFQGAEESFERAVALDPSLTSAWFNLARLYLVQEREAEAVEALETFLERAGPRFPALVRWTRDTLVHLR
jgi:tetratricopeptide (TPR) repeat protein